MKRLGLLLWLIVSTLVLLLCLALARRIGMVALAQPR